MARRRRNKLPPEPVNTTIQSLSHEGRGIASIDGKTTFIFGALPGEDVEFVYTSKRGSHDEGKTTAVLTAAPERVEPQCPHFTICGGCSLQHLDHGEQIKHKQQVLLDHLRHFGKLTPNEVLEPLTGPAWGYRNKARLGVRYVFKKDSTLVGFRERGSAFLAVIDQCEILNPRVGQLITPLRELIHEFENKREIAQIEVSIGDTDVALVFRNLVELTDDEKTALINFGQQHNIQIFLQPAGPASVYKLYPNDDTNYLTYSLPDFDLTMQFHPMDFTQVNTDINRKMVKRSVDFLQLTKEDTVLDLFCGLGNFTLPIATQAKHVVGVEGSDLMTERAGMNAKANKLSNVEFHAANLMESIDEFEWAKQHYDKILLDPPRSGAEMLVQQIERFNASLIVYVSCNPATLARDAAILAEKGYKLNKAGIMDMFPHTSHVESIAVFSK
tara:strand:+ start:1768 stop:3096 length:1329 start_codon:yes stop_codon:yes gene_type:complete